MEVTDKTFNQLVLESNLPVLVMFWASWCPVCKTMQPMLKNLREEIDDKVKILHLNIDRNPHKSVEYDIKATPTFYIFKDGKPLERIFGAHSKTQLKQFIGKAI